MPTRKRWTVISPVKRKKKQEKNGGSSKKVRAINTIQSERTPFNTREIFCYPRTNNNNNQTMTTMYIYIYT